MEKSIETYVPHKKDFWFNVIVGDFNEWILRQRTDKQAKELLDQLKQKHDKNSR